MYPRVYSSQHNRHMDFKCRLNHVRSWPHSSFLLPSAMSLQGPHALGLTTFARHRSTILLQGPFTFCLLWNDFCSFCAWNAPHFCQQCCLNNTTGTSLTSWGITVHGVPAPFSSPCCSFIHSSYWHQCVCECVFFLVDNRKRIKLYEGNFFGG